MLWPGHPETQPLCFHLEAAAHQQYIQPHISKGALTYTDKITWMSASGFSRLRISAASCCLSSSTMEAKATGEEGGGLPTAPSTQGLRGVAKGRTMMQTDRNAERITISASNKSLSAWIKAESTATERLLLRDGYLSNWISQASYIITIKYGSDPHHGGR